MKHQSAALPKWPPEYLIASQDKRSLADINMRIGKLYNFFGANKVMGKLEGAGIRAFRQGEGMGSVTINRDQVFKKACTLAGIKDFTIHDLWHTCASWLVSEGLPLDDVKEVGACP